VEFPLRSKFPFLMDWRKVLEELGISPGELLTGELKEQVERRLKGESIPYTNYRYPERTFLAFLILLAGVDDDQLRNEILPKEVSMFVSAIKSSEELIQLMRGLGLEAELSHEKRNNAEFDVILVQLIPYLTETSKFRDELLSLRSLQVRKGVVRLDQPVASKLIEHLIRERISSLINDIRKEMGGSSIHSISKNERFPPCIIEVNSKDQLNEIEASALGTFLANVNLWSEAERVLRAYSELQTKIGSGRYIIYSCKRMKELGLCVNDCGTENPLQYYFSQRMRRGSEGRHSRSQGSP